MKQRLNDLAALVLFIAIVVGVLWVGVLVFGRSSQACINGDRAQGYTMQQALDDCIGENR